MTMKNVLAAGLAIPLAASAAVIVPPPVIRPPDLRTDEKPIEVTKTETIVEENAYFRRVSASFVFTNPNARTMGGDFEFPIPEGAFVCGYKLEINGEMVPGVVCEKEKARVAFENEVRKGVDPGLVEQVKGNVWKTRVFPLNPKTPRKAEVEYVVDVVESKGKGEVEEGESKGKGEVEERESKGKGEVEGEVKDRGTVYERDGDWLFTASASERKQEPVAQQIRAFAKGTILWDASLSRLDKTAADRKRLEENLSETGDWQFVAFSNVPDAPKACKTKAEVLAAVDAVVYDGGTDLAAAVAALPPGERPLLFTDEMQTLSETDVDLDSGAFVLGSRPDAAPQSVNVTRRKWSEVGAWGGTEPKASSLLATVWAARRMQDLASQADSRKDEFLALGRQYGVAGPGLSLIVFERLDQWLEHKIEPPKTLALHAEWVKRRAADDDPIAEKRAKADHEKRLLELWEERVRWWKDPKPRRETPKSGLFESMSMATGAAERGALADSVNAVRAARRSMRMSAARESAAASHTMAADVADGAMAADMEEGAAAAEPMMEPVRMRSMAGRIAGAKKGLAAGAAGSDARPSVTLKAWDPKTPYVDALKAAAKGAAYAVYLKQRATYKDSPAFYLDCAGWFFQQGEAKTALRVISNLAEFKLENAALWRTMAWRLREATAYDEAVRAFRHAKELRGEEGQSFRDLALVLCERGKRNGSAKDLEEAMALFAEAAFRSHARRATRRGNDMQVSVIALEELNGLIAWCAANKSKVGEVKSPAFDAAYRRDLPVKLRIVMSWDADETDIDLHVLEPNGEEAYYGHRRTSEGGFVSEDVTTGYGPEEYLKKDLETGVYKVLSNYFASHQTSLTGATTVTATVYTDWATDKEAMQILTLRLDKPRDKHLIGEVKLGE